MSFNPKTAVINKESPRSPSGDKGKEKEVSDKDVRPSGWKKKKKKGGWWGQAWSSTKGQKQNAAEEGQRDQSVRGATKPT